MSKFDDLISELNSRNITAESCDWEENIPNDLYNEHFKDNFTNVASGLNVDTHRWYEISTDVIKIYDRLMGIRNVSNLFSESMCCSDCCVDMSFVEMEEFTTVGYRAKKV